MTIPSLSRARALTQRGVNAVVTKISPGVYALGTLGLRGGVHVRYVGRSDLDLNSELQDSIGRATHFVYAYLDSPMAAFLAE